LGHMRNAKFLRVRGVGTGQVRTKEGGCRTGQNKRGRAVQDGGREQERSEQRMASAGQVRTKEGGNRRAGTAQEGGCRTGRR
jgi:hypothetical protein